MRRGRQSSAGGDSGRRAALALVMALAVLVSATAIGSAGAQTLFLVTPEEARLPDAPIELPAEPGATLGPSRKGTEALEVGPRILVIKPTEGLAVTGPLDIEVQFQPQDDAAVDLATLEVKYVKLVSIDITDRVRPYASPEGIRVERVSFPRGKHTIRISIADTRGALTSRILSVTIQ
ncbi:MAG: hypothetical protein ACRDH5_04300 [bacterium]